MKRKNCRNDAEPEPSLTRLLREECLKRAQAYVAAREDVGSYVMEGGPEDDARAEALEAVVAREDAAHKVFQALWNTVRVLDAR